MELERYIKILFQNRNNSRILVVDGSIAGVGISEGSMNLSKMICDGGFELGGCYSSKFEAQIFGLDEDLSGWWITVYSDYNDVKEFIFKGIVDSCRTDPGYTYRDLVAYDYLYTLRDADATTFWHKLWDNGSRAYTLADIRRIFCNFAGFGRINTIQRTLFNDSISLTNNEDLVDASTLMRPQFETLTVGEFFKMLGEIQFFSPHITNTGALDFITLGDAHTPIDLDDVYAKNDCDFELYITAQPVGFKVENSTTKQIYIVSSSADADANSNLYVLKDNPILNLADSSQLDAVLTPLLDRISRIVYTPATVPLIVSDLSIPLGAYCRIGSDESTYKYFWAFAETYSGAMLVDMTIESPAVGQYLNGQCDSYLDGQIPGMPEDLHGKAMFITSDGKIFKTSEDEDFLVINIQ